MYFKVLVKPCCPMVCWYVHASCLFSFFNNNNNNATVMNIVWTLLMGIWMWNDTDRPKTKKSAGLLSPRQRHHLLHKAWRKTYFSHIHLGTVHDVMLRVTVWPFSGPVGSLCYPKGRDWEHPTSQSTGRSWWWTLLHVHQNFTEFQTNSHCLYFPIFVILNSFCSWEYLIHLKCIQNSFTRKSCWSKMDA